MNDNLLDKVRRFPELPGVYLLKDTGGRIIYVGKARSLRQRVRSYFAGKETLSPRLKSLQATLTDIDFVVTDTEVEALILECNLIKEHRPRFNVNMKDDKDYPYLILTAEQYPRLELLRLSQTEGRRGRYRQAPGRNERRFGPFTNVGAVRDTMRLLGEIIPLRRCRQPLDGQAATIRPCLNFQMKRCLAPCRGEAAVSSTEYNKMAMQVAFFLDGRYNELEKKLQQQMEEAACDQRFEEAAGLRDRLYALQRVTGQQQKMLSAEKAVNRDVLALARYERWTAMHLFKIRDGKLLSQDHFSLSGASDVDDEEVAAAFIKSYYSRAAAVPNEIILSVEPAEVMLLRDWLMLECERKVNLRVPRRGSLKKLVDLAQRNCLLHMQEEVQRRKRREQQPLQELGHLTGLSADPDRIEGFDISHHSGDESVGAMVVFKQGRPQKEGYRHFIVRQAPASDDYAALREVLRRRANKNSWPVPDLIFIDGGRGQLTTAREALNDTALSAVPLISLSKNPDQIHLEATAVPLLLPAENAVMQILQRIRDEAHRFAIDHHRRLRRRRSTSSFLEAIPGVGPARRTALLSRFGSLDLLRQATVDQLMETPGINHDLAASIYRSIRDKL